MTVRKINPLSCGGGEHILEVSHKDYVLEHLYRNKKILRFVLFYVLFKVYLEFFDFQKKLEENRKEWLRQREQEKEEQVALREHEENIVRSDDNTTVQDCRLKELGV